jgi:RNA polymerase sigma-70 factor, ECF subfamily
MQKLSARTVRVVDRSLVESARLGDRIAFGELALTLGDRLHAVAHRILRDRDLAGDVAQEALVKIWRELPRLRDVDRFDGWAYRVLLNACRDEIRRRRPATVELLEIDGWIPDTSLSVSDRDQLERAFVRLSADQRSVVILHYYLDHSLAEIATIVDIPVGTVRSRLHYAKRALRAAIDAERRPVVNRGQSA